MLQQTEGVVLERGERPELGSRDRVDAFDLAEDEPGEVARCAP